VKSLARQGFEHEFGRSKTVWQADPAWDSLLETGTRLWLDTGDLEEASRLWCSQFQALTTNNTLLNKEVQKGIYDALVQESVDLIRTAAPNLEEKDLLLELAFFLNAYHGLRLVERFDAFVSVELHTDLADDVQRTVAYGKRFHEVCPERFIVKVPFTPAGILGARRLGQMGVPVNLTMGFSARQNVLVALLSNPSYVNVFMGRLDAFVADNQLGNGDNVGEKATLATQRNLLALRQAKKTSSLLIGASMRSGNQVASLAGVDVFTMPTQVARQYLDMAKESLESQVHVDPPVRFETEQEQAGCGADRLWDVPQSFLDCVEGLAKENLDFWTPADLRHCLEEASYGDLFPDWLREEREIVAREGKIPVFSTWRESLAEGRVGLDALLNLSGLYSFMADQKALDDRVRSLIL